MKRLYETIDDATFFTNYGIFLAISGSTVYSWLSGDNAKSLDTEYYYNHSNEKWISPMFEKLIDLNGGVIDTTLMNKLVSIINLKFGDKWNRLHDAFINAVYNPIENYSMVETTEVDSDVSTNNNIYGFNSGAAVPVSEQNVTANRLNNVTEVNRSGNIGVTTSQQMLESEIKLREWNFFEQMMKDVDSVLCLQLY